MSVTVRPGRPQGLAPQGVAHVSNIVVIYYSAGAHVHRLAEAVAQGAIGACAEARVRGGPGAGHPKLRWVGR
jgi:hypothetical protein